MKTSELTGAALNWAVAMCEPDDKLAIYFDETTGEPLCHDDWPDNQEFKPSSDWTMGGPIIEREGMGVWMYQWNERGEPENGWYAEDKNGDHVRTGTTPLIAAMRCYVASKLGDEVQIPEELK